MKCKMLRQKSPGLTDNQQARRQISDAAFLFEKLQLTLKFYCTAPPAAIYLPAHGPPQMP